MRNLSLGFWHELFVLLLFFCAFTTVTLAQSPPLTDAEIQAIEAKGLAQPPLLSTPDLKDKIMAICVKAYAYEQTGDKAAYIDLRTKARQCASCGQLALAHKLASFTAESCTSITSGPNAFQWGTMYPNSTDHNNAGQYCTNTCLANPGLVPDQAALAEGRINVIDAGTGQYKVVSRNGSSNQMGVTCGLPRPGLDGDDTVTQCCNPDYNTDAIAGQAGQTEVFGCLPGAWSTAITVGQNFVNSQLDGVRALGDIARGKFKSALPKIGNQLTFGTLKMILDKKDSKDKEDFCISHIPRFLMGKVLNTSSGQLLATSAAVMRPRPCTEAASPTINGQLATDPSSFGSTSCRCMYSEDVKTPNGAAPIGDNLCTRYLGESGELQSCRDCSATGGIYTGIGCVGTNLPGITKSLVSFGVTIGGGIALLSIFYAAFMIQTSRGNPERIKKGREYLNSALIGLALIIFSVLILQVIGVDLLRIPGLSR